MPSITVKDAAAATQTIQTLPAVGQATKAASLPVTLASDQGNISVAIASGGITSGTAGTPSADVLTVQGAASMTPLSVTNAAGTAMIGHVGGVEYETVAASATAQALGATGATGDYIAGILVIPATTSPGSVTLLDNATSITVFTGGAASVSNLVPFFIPLGIKSVSGAWKITTGANVSCIGVGDFT